MIAIFPLVYIFAFVLAISDIVRGKKDGFILFLIFGLSIYTTVLSVTFSLGFKSLIPILQSLKEVFVILVLGISIFKLKTKIKLHYIDYLIIAFFIYTLLYAFLPVGEQGFGAKIMAFKTLSFFVLVYFCGRLYKPGEIYISKYFHYILLLSIAAAAVLLTEVITDQHLQTRTGYADYNFYLFNFEPSGNYGLTWTFESEGGYKRFASFFANPLEFASATVIALAVLAALYTTDKYKLKLDNFGYIALAATLCCIIFAFSRSAFISYFILLYVYSVFTKKKYIYHTVHVGALLATIYVIYLFVKEQDQNDGLQMVIMNTINFSNPSSVGHVVEWIEGALAIASSPLGLGLGSSGRIGGSLGENVGGENQYIIIGVQAGIIALILYLTIYVCLIKESIKWYYRLEGKEKKICLAILLIKIGFIIPSLTSEIETSSYTSYLMWFLSGLFVNIISTKVAIQNEQQELLD
ncbi:MULTISPECIES: O-antigen ligase [unclassified Pedobacter]|uniref:O-antigen ligase family protein n=1 Tax=unclassified Pedobacter TaxID=2628915 RepID=UPI001E44FE26|nr:MULTISPECIES: O-antigen ligase family protein [unclassified Pedobacter]